MKLKDVFILISEIFGLYLKGGFVISFVALNYAKVHSFAVSENIGF